MNPWTLIGWALVALISIPILFVALRLLGAVRLTLTIRAKHYLTRNDPPAAGQRWTQDGTSLWIDRIAENGRIVIRSGRSSWSDSPEEWRRRVRNRRLWRDK